MKEYKRRTVKGRVFGDKVNDSFKELYTILQELEDKIENGTLIEPKYPLYSIVFIIDYINEKGYSVYGGKPIVRECFVTSITQIIKEEGKLLYRVQPKDLPNDVLEGKVEHCEYWERAWWEKDLFLTKAEAEAKLKEKGE